ncbi:MAG: hypothetical protein HY582_00935 [Candidatus Omnitrophica bacterium]|nr:hypothetical protein [Candidatus Omnitrophota bacterium]
MKSDNDKSSLFSTTQCGGSASVLPQITYGTAPLCSGNPSPTSGGRRKWGVAGSIKFIVIIVFVLLIGFFWVMKQKGVNIITVIIPKPKPVEVIEEDLNGDGKADAYHYYREKVLFRINRDRNFDGKLDEWIDVKNDKWSFRKADENYDRIVDVKDYFSSEQVLRKRERSLTYDQPRRKNKFPYVEHYNAKGQLEQVKHDTNDDGKADVWKVFKEEHLFETKVDKDFDGKPDQTITAKSTS